MPKSLLIDPAEARQRGVLAAPAIPLNAYVPDPKAEALKYGRGSLVRMYRDMALIREFETMLDRIKKEGVYEGIAYNHKGPAHLSIGQEAAAVGQAYHLGPDDYIFGSHRSHGEIIAKSLSAIARMREVDVQRVMEGYMDGAALQVVERFAGKGSERSKHSDPYADGEFGLAIDFVLYGTLAEIFGRAAGFNRGMGGSMHAFFPPFGVMPNNAIVGGSADIATGAALFKRVNRRPGIVIANIGDASMGCGPVWEAMNFAAMDQFHTLWGKEDLTGLNANSDAQNSSTLSGLVRGHPPILFNFMNNFYGMGGQPKGETMGFEVLARAGLGVNPQAMHAERVDGYNPLAVADAIERKRKVLEAGEGPVLLDVVTYRYSGHSPSDASSYRDASELKLWQQQDALPGYGAYLIDNGHAVADEIEAIHEDAKRRICRVLEAAASLEISPRLSLRGDEIGAMMFSSELPLPPSEKEAPTPDPSQREGRQIETLIPIEESRLKQTRGKFRFAFDAEGKPHPKLKTLTYAEALFEAMIQRFYEDPTMIAYGEENRDWGGAFGVYRGLTECLPHHRLFNSPISEAAIAGTAVGYALSGGRVVAELMYCDFMGRAGDEIFNQMAKWQAMSGGTLTLPMVLRVSVGSKYGAQHSQDWSSICAHIPGLQVFFPATPYDAKGMLALALRSTNPVVFFESQRLYAEPERLVAGGVPVEHYEAPLGEPAVRRAGDDITLITIGSTLYVALEAANALQKLGLSAEVIDLRFLNPLNYAPLVDSVRKTGRCVIASDACERGSFAHTVASNLTQMAFDALDGPIAVVGARNWITPPAEMEEAFFPQPAWILDVIHERILPLPHHSNTTSPTDDELLRRNRLGI